jgi:hypothetical protein
MPSLFERSAEYVLRCARPLKPATVLRAVNCWPRAARAVAGDDVGARIVAFEHTGAPNAAKTDALRGRNTALENRPSASVPAPCSRGWAFT